MMRRKYIYDNNKNVDIQNECTLQASGTTSSRRVWKYQRGNQKP